MLKENDSVQPRQVKLRRKFGVGRIKRTLNPDTDINQVQRRAQDDFFEIEWESGKTARWPARALDKVG